MMSENTPIEQTISPLFEHFVTILEQASSNVVKSITDRVEILHPQGGELTTLQKNITDHSHQPAIPHPGGGQTIASKYMLYLPTEDQLQQEIQRELKLIESVKGERDE